MLSPDKVSVVLISYARPWNMPRICESLLDYGFRDIHLVDNWQPSWESDGTPCRTDRSMLETQFDPDLWDKISYVKARKNVKTASRYLSIDSHVRNDVIATLDDDYIVTGKGWDNILGAWTGDRIVAQLPNTGEQFKNAHKIPFVNLGYGSLFHRDWIGSVFRYLIKGGHVSIDEFHRFADRIFTTFHGSWDAVKADDRTLIRLRNHNGEFSDTDSSSIHLKDGYWIDQWNLVMKVMGLRRNARSLYVRNDPSLFEYRSQMGFLSRIAYGDSVPESGC